MSEDKNYYDIELVDNVRDFFEDSKNLASMCTEIRMEKEFSKTLKLCESPIEQMFCIAIETMLLINQLDLRISEGQEKIFYKTSTGILVMPQYEIGKYRVDFLLGYIGVLNVPAELGEDGENWRRYRKELVVELDGHKFHEMNEKERRYEKNRDRFLQRKGYTVFHYTGSEIVKNPYNAALECVMHLTGRKREEIWWANSGKFGVKTPDS